MTPVPDTDQRQLAREAGRAARGTLVLVGLFSLGMVFVSGEIVSLILAPRRDRLQIQDIETAVMTVALAAVASFAIGCFVTFFGCDRFERAAAWAILVRLSGGALVLQAPVTVTLRYVTPYSDQALVWGVALGLVGVALLITVRMPGIGTRSTARLLCLVTAVALLTVAMDAFLLSPLIVGIAGLLGGAAVIGAPSPVARDPQPMGTQPSAVV